jgi:hypothetical protein
MKATALLLAPTTTTAANPGMVQPGVPDGVPDDFDCAMRKFAWEYGQRLRPDRGTFRTLFEALQLQACDLSTPAEMDVWAPPALPTPTAGKLVFVAPGGSDGAAGTKDAPLATIAAAVRATAGANPATVLLRAGTHEIASTVELGPANSGLTIQNYAGEAAVVTGAKALSVPQAAWKVYKQGDKWDVAPDQNSVFGAAKLKADTAFIKYVGDFDSAAACAAAATADAAKKGPFLSFSWQGVGADVGPFQRGCYGQTDDVWAPHAQAGVVSGYLVRQNTWVADVRQAGLVEMPGLRVDGRRAIRAKYPNGDPEQSGHYLTGAGAANGGGDYIKGWVPLSAGTQWVKPARKPDSEDVVIVAADWPGVEWPMTVAGGGSAEHWTGEGDWGEFHIGVGGYCNDLSPPSGYWCAMAPPRGQCWDKAKNEGSGCVQTHMSPDGMVLARAANWSDPTTGVVQSWRGGGRWFTQQWLVESFDAATSTLSFDNTTGHQGGEGGTTSGQWWIENIKEECDSANEFFFDAKEQLLYYNPNSTDAGPTGEEEWAVPLTRVLFDLQGTADKPATDIAIKGVTIRDARYTYMDAHGMPSGGDWALQRSAAITMEGVERIELSDSLVTRVDGNGVGINGYARNVTVKHNEFSWIGDSAMFAWGHTSTCLNANCTKKTPYTVGPDGRGGQQPWGTVIANNLVRELGIWQKQSSMWFQAVTAQTQLVDNVHFNGPRAGVNFNDGFAGGDTMKGNLIANCVRESGDHGPFNSWDRVPYITDIGSTPGKPTIIPALRDISQNFIISTYSSQEAIDTDDGSAYYNTHDNFFVYAANGLKSDFGGHDNYHNDNLYGYVNNCWKSQGLNGNSDQFINNTCVTNSDTGGFQSDCKKPPLMTVSGNKIYNKQGTISGKFCDTTNVVVGKNPPADAIVAMAKVVLGVK